MNPLVLFVQGLGAGVVCIFFVGPVLFTLLAAAVDGGFGAAARVALGIAASDAVAVALVALGLGPVLAQPSWQPALQLASGVIIGGFGAVMLGTAGRARVSTDPAPRGRGRFAAGFLVNFVNPFVLTFWVGAVGGVGVQHGLSAGVLVPFFGGMIATILLSDLAKAALAAALQRHLTGPALTWARRASGALLLAAGVGLIVHLSLAPGAAWTP